MQDVSNCLDQFLAAIYQICDYVRDMIYPEPPAQSHSQSEISEEEDETPIQEPPATVEELNRQLSEIKDEYLKSVVEIDWYHAQTSKQAVEAVIETTI